MNKFVLERLDKKIKYWVFTHLNCVGRIVVSNNILIASMMFFLAIWSGTCARIKKATMKVRNFMWTGTELSTRAKVV